MKKLVLAVAAAVSVSVLLSSLVSVALVYLTRPSEDDLSRVSRNTAKEVFQEQFRNQFNDPVNVEVIKTKLSDELSQEEKDEILKYQRLVGIQLTIIPQKDGKAQEDEAFTLDPYFSQGYLYKNYVLVVAEPLYSLPQTLPDGSRYETKISTVLFPNSQVENANFQEQLEELVWTGGAELPILVFARPSTLFLSTPSDNIPVTPLAELTGGKEIYQLSLLDGFAAFPGASILFVNQENGFFVFQGNMELENLEGSLLFEKTNGRLQGVGLMVKRKGSLNGTGISLERLLAILDEYQIN